MAMRVLLVDDEPLNVDSLSSFLAQDGYEVFVAPTGRDALELFRAQEARGEPIPLVLTDLRMPVMDGAELIRHLLAEGDPPVVIIQSVVDDIDRIIQFMRQGVYDYVVKPYSFGELLLRVDKAAEYVELRRMKSSVERERQLRRDLRINWKGSGVANLVGSLQTMARQAREVSDGYLIESALMRSVVSSVKAAASLMELIQQLDDQRAVPLHGEVMTAQTLRKLVMDAASECGESADLRSHFLTVGDVEECLSPKRILIEPNSFKSVIAELLLNAMKFSEPQSTIAVNFAFAPRNRLRLSVLSHPVVDAFGNHGIMPEYRHLVFEPFYRLSLRTHDGYPTHDLGLGLTLVDRILQRHDATITAFNVTGTNLETLVNFELELKVLDAV